MTVDGGLEGDGEWRGDVAGGLLAGDLGVDPGADGPIAALRETSVVFAAMVGAVWLRETFGRRSVASAGIVLLQAQ